MTTDDYNNLILSRLSVYLNDYADFITQEMMEEATAGGILSVEEGYRALLAGALNLYDDRVIMNDYLRHMVRRLQISDYQQNPYYRAVRFSEGTEAGSGEGSGTRLDGRQGWQLAMKRYKPYEAFVCGDLKETEDGRLLPQIGFFEEEYEYPCVLQDGREWMLITPNEIETMKEPIARARGRVVTYGLGLGYFAFMTAAKPEVSRVTVVELDPAVIRLFETCILPRFSDQQRRKIKIVEEDALAYGARLTSADADYVFADIWHDPSDGLPLYGKLKTLEKPGVEYDYWIEDTMKCYL